MNRVRSALFVTSAALASTVLVAPAASAIVTDPVVGSTTVAQGIAYVEVTTTCTIEGEQVYLGSQVRQTVGRTRTVEGSWDTYATCTDGVATGTVAIIASSGKFAGGPAYITAVACDNESCEQTQVTRKLSGR